MPRITIPHSWISKLSKENQLIELNNTVRCTIKKSDIHGIGVFTLRRIKEGERCYCTPEIEPKFYNIPYASLSKLLPEIRELIVARWASVVNGSVFQSPNADQSLLMFMNHQRFPNCNYDVMTDTSLRDIEKGEEVTEDYCFMENATKVYPWLVCDEGH